jgi:redox-sensitive bicupin YhaK (pirin superfamily)
MMSIRKARDRGHSVSDWLNSWHSFSFANYYDPEHSGFRALRVINQDRVAPGKGFPMHPHRDMEILSFVLQGALQHNDNLGHEDIIRAGEVQRMTAGSGIIHSEFNASASEAVHFLQIWIEPQESGLVPGYEICRFDEPNENSLQLLASSDGRSGSATIQQDIALFSGQLQTGRQLEWQIAKDRHVWLQILQGELEVNELRLQRDDGLAISQETAIQLTAAAESRFLVFDLN